MDDRRRRRRSRKFKKKDKDEAPNYQLEITPHPPTKEKNGKQTAQPIFPFQTYSCPNLSYHSSIPPFFLSCYFKCIPLLLLLFLGGWVGSDRTPKTETKRNERPRKKKKRKRFFRVRCEDSAEMRLRLWAGLWAWFCSCLICLIDLCSSI